MQLAMWSPPPMPTLMSAAEHSRDLLNTQSAREHAPTCDTTRGRPPLASSGTNVAQSAAPLLPPTVIAYAWHSWWSLYEHALTVHSLTAGISVVVIGRLLSA